MKIDILTLFPNMFKGPFDESIMKRARDRKVVTVKTRDLRDWTSDRHRSADDTPYGGGPGMVMKVEPVYRALKQLIGTVAIRKDTGSAAGGSSGRKRRVILLTPQGRPFSQKIARELSKSKHLVFICGHYEGFDERARRFATDELSIGDYVLTCGEIPAMVIIDAVVRLLPGALGDCGSSVEESFEGGLLEYPQYTKPRMFRKMPVPEVLLGGNHALIKEWRHRESVERTRERRPDLWKKQHK
ncbi:MAG: tRNA (guanosine(37)-N1)-methyltransferase TrmD [Candidatus Omnitrophota bacterium]